MRGLAQQALRGVVAPTLLQKLSRREVVSLLSAHLAQEQNGGAGVASASTSPSGMEATALHAPGGSTAVDMAVKVACASTGLLSAASLSVVPHPGAPGSKNDLEDAQMRLQVAKAEQRMQRSSVAGAGADWVIDINDEASTAGGSATGRDAALEQNGSSCTDNTSGREILQDDLLLPGWALRGSALLAPGAAVAAATAPWAVPALATGPEAVAAACSGPTECPEWPTEGILAQIRSRDFLLKPGLSEQETPEFMAGAGGVGRRRRSSSASRGLALQGGQEREGRFEAWRGEEEVGGFGEESDGSGGGGEYAPLTHLGREPIAASLRRPSFGSAGTCLAQGSWGVPTAEPFTLAARAACSLRR